jgi:hypothetical protein
MRKVLWLKLGDKKLAKKFRPPQKMSYGSSIAARNTKLRTTSLNNHMKLNGILVVLAVCWMQLAFGDDTCPYAYAPDGTQYDFSNVAYQ